MGMRPWRKDPVSAFLLFCEPAPVSSWPRVIKPMKGTKDEVPVSGGGERQGVR